MSVITVRVSDILIEDMLKTGNTIDRTTVTEGLPDDAKLTGISFNEYGWVKLYFQTKKGEDRDVSIILQTIRDV